MQKRSISIHGHRTSLLLEPVFWSELEKIAARKKMTMPALITYVDRNRIRNVGSNAGDSSETLPSLASSLRVYVVKQLMQTY